MHTCDDCGVPGLQDMAGGVVGGVRGITAPAPRAFVEQLPFFFFLPYCTACEILVPGPGIKPTTLGLVGETLTTGPLGDVPTITFLRISLTDSF